MSISRLFTWAPNMALGTRRGAEVRWTRVGGPGRLAAQTSIVVILILGSDLAAAPRRVPQERGPDAARAAFPDGVRLPWYDPQADRLRPLTLAPEEPLRRASDWEWRQRQASNSARPGSGSWEGLWRLLQYVVWAALAGVFAVLVYLWMRAVVRHEVEQQDAWAEAEKRRYASDAVEQLPFSIPRPQADLREEARRHYLARDYREAIIYLFSYQLLHLDRHQRIHLAKGKTNRQYLHELRGRPALRQLLTQTMLAFEDVFFGHYDLEQERFEASWNRLAEFERLVEQDTNGAGNR